METLCFLCSKKIGPFIEQYSTKDFQNDRVSLPPNFTEDRRTCATCFNQLKKTEKEFENLAKQNSDLDKKERIEDLRRRVGQYKPMWDKNGVIQYKDEFVAILQRTWGVQVEFIIAYSDLTKEGYRLMAIDEGKSGGQSSGGFTGGVNSYYYFQKIQYVK
ncbi:MAG: hypothetical protein ACRD9Q_08900 [Nitrososphaeraceae archaeon]